MTSMPEGVRRNPSTVEDPVLVKKNQQRLIEAATRLFRKNSYHATSIGDVAKEARMSVGGVYLYIETKSDLLLLIFNEVVEIYKSRIYLINELPGTALDKVHRAIKEYYIVLDEHHAKTEIMYHEFGALDPSARPYLVQVEKELEDTIFRIVKKGVSDGEFDNVDPRVFARNMLWLGHMWALNRGRVRDNMTIARFIKQQTEYLDRVLGAGSKREEI
jgi:TetR/AcrR family transcriptional regulator, cholesterol catabolism regulator